MRINEIFYSFSGEGLSTGIPTIFVRFAGCNFHSHPCLFPCDTKYSLNYSSGEELSLKEVMTNIVEYPGQHVILTGGEPLVQRDDVINLTQVLLCNHFTVEIITNGSRPIFNAPVTWSVDIKTPSSGNSLYNVWSNLERLKRGDQIKFVIGSIADFEFAHEVLHMYPTKAQVLLQMAWGKIDTEEFVETVKYEFPKARISWQTHKFIYGQRRGV
jgi:7-carboxy-7-deazaguanine synthase